jgi:hypothetical protein
MGWHHHFALPWFVVPGCGHNISTQAVYTGTFAVICPYRSSTAATMAAPPAASLFTLTGPSVKEKFSPSLPETGVTGKPRGYQALPEFYVLCFSSARNSASLRVFTPNFSALANLEPGSALTTT